MRGQFDATAFHAALDSQRQAKKLNWKEVSADSGVSASTLTRMSQGKRPDVDSLAALLTWSGLKVDDFIQKDSSIGQAEPLAMITAYLRADKNLSPESATALEEIIRAAYNRFKG